MGMSLFKSCGTGYTVGAPAPNPDPKRWNLLDHWPFKNGYVLRVHYFDATNFEGIKVMVYRGGYSGRKSLDPHFQPGPASPIARFRPDEEGIEMAKKLAASL